MSDTQLPAEPVPAEPVPAEPLPDEPIEVGVAPAVPEEAEPVAAEPIADESEPDVSIADEPVPAEPVADEPVPVEPVADESEPDVSLADEPVPVEPVADEPVPVEPVADESEPDEPVADEPVAAEPFADEPEPTETLAVEPVPDEPVAAVPEPAPSRDVMPLMSHLRELRDRLLRAVLALVATTAISFLGAKQVLEFLISPVQAKLQALKPTESLSNYMKVALICGVTLAMPFIVYQLGRFLAPGLTKKERRWLYVLVPGATLFFLAGVSFAFFIMAPAAIGFLHNFMSDIIEQNWTIGEYLSFLTSMLLWIGLAFETPLFMFFLAKVGVVDYKFLAKNRKYAILIMAIVAALVTPTVDPFNMMLVMLPLVMLFELGIILARIARPKPKPVQASETES